ncbi:hypothetical protein [Rummeliibacillus stabekisii]|uniref:hypothetical protein n=1 Tax=Rummeliibacillus stabekisii TaxID=241244 RepID=UPI00371902D0
MYEHIPSILKHCLVMIFIIIGSSIVMGTAINESIQSLNESVKKSIKVVYIPIYSFNLITSVIILFLPKADLIFHILNAVSLACFVYTAILFAIQLHYVKHGKLEELDVA